MSISRTKPSELRSRVLIVEDDERTRAGLAAAVTHADGFELVGSFERALPAMAWLETNQADILLTDLGLPDASGIDVIRFCALHWPACDILVITMFGDEKNVLTSIEAGAIGYLLKDGETLDLERALLDLRSGGSPMSPLIARKVLARAAQREVVTEALPNVALAEANLTKREVETLNLIARGYTYEEAGALLAISLSTVQTYIRSIYGKLAVNSRGEAVFEAHKLGLLNLDPIAKKRD